ncbi:hypothetical protein ES705_46882 [subsurface metagenome]
MIVNAAGGPDPIQVCAGVQTIITIQDNSTWNCQNPTVYGALSAKPNTAPRNIEWLYGQDPSGTLTNTINGIVTIGGGLGNAPTTSGRISPLPYGPSSLSQTITIPASCEDGQYFRVYLKNWNVCNWLDAQYISTFIDILVTAPVAPSIGATTFCEGSVPATITATGSGGTLTWWTDAGCTLPAGGLANPLVHGKTEVGTYPFWVKETSASGCNGPATQVDLIINPLPTVNVGGAMAAICQGGTSSALRGSFGGGATSAVWSDGGAGGSFANNGGATPGTATYTAGAASGTPVTLTLTTAGGSCGTTFATKNITVNPNPTVNAGAAVAAICQGGTTVALNGSFGGGATSAIWSDGGAGGSFTNNGGATPATTTYTAGAASGTPVTLTLTTAGGLCGTTFASKLQTVNPNLTDCCHRSSNVYCWIGVYCN